ncbi:MAG: molecular chaperone HtpG, partial [Bacteroidales bacterium]
YERAENFALFKNVEGKYFTFEEYKKLIDENQKDKNKQLVYLYTTDADKQHSFIEKAKSKAYDVLLLDGQLDAHFINHLEQKFQDSRFARVDADVIDKLIEKEDVKESHLEPQERTEMSKIFESQVPEKNNFMVSFEALGEDESPVIITQSEFIRRMKDMSAMSGTDAFYGNMPDSYNLVVNTDHPLVYKLIEQKNKKLSSKLSEIQEEMSSLNVEKEKLDKANEKKKEEEISQADKDKTEDLNKKISEVESKRTELLSGFGNKNKLVKQLIDLALLSNNMLKGEALTSFVKRSVELIK